MCIFDKIYKNRKVFTAKYVFVILPQSLKNSVIVRLIKKIVKAKIKNFPASYCSPNKKYAQIEYRNACVSVIGIFVINQNQLCSKLESEQWISEMTVAMWYAEG